MTGGDAVERLVALRRELHAHPELSGLEAETAERIRRFLADWEPDELHTGVGGHGLLAVFDSGKPGPSVAFRCELDALPIEEANDLPYRSIRPGVSHKCGHDGHMATVAGLASQIRSRGLPRGKAILLFQAAEESGEGAAAMLRDPRFSSVKPDRVFAFHNLPKFPFRQVIVRENTFACASVGLVACFRGSSTHSSYPEHGRSPAPAVAALIAELTQLGTNAENRDGLALGTVTQAQLGDMSHKIDFGVAPATGCVIAVLRAERQVVLEELKRVARQAAEEIARAENLDVELEWREEFAATENRADSVKIIERAARRAGFEVRRAAEPFRWSEDFGLFLQQVPGALFGLGSGEDQPQLHNEHYDYPDALIPDGLRMYWAILQEVLEAGPD